MTFKIQLQNYTHYQQQQTVFLQNQTIWNSQRNNRKNSNQSVQTKTSEFSDYFQIDVVYCEHTFVNNQSVCQNCGMFVLKNTNLKVIKTRKYFGVGWNISNLRQSSKRFQTRAVNHLSFASRDVIEKASQRFNFSLTTQALGVYIFYTVFDGINQFLQVCISLFVAAKLMQHTNIKLLRRFRKYLNKCFKISDYQEMQYYILQKMNFNLNIPTFLDFIFCYLHRGIVLSNEQINCQDLQYSIISRSKQILFKGTFMMFEPQVVASNILFSIRQSTGVKQPWCQSIQQITELTQPYFVFSNQQPNIPLELF